MSERPQTFSESWYRIADQRIHLRTGVRVRRQFFRGELWFVLEDPFNNQFFRLRPAAHDFIIRLRRDRTVQEVWQECLERNPDETPGQEEIIRLISQLYFANLLQYEMPADSAKLFQRYRQRREREFKSRWLNIMFLRIPLYDPDELLNHCQTLIRWVFSPLGALLWFIMVGLGIKTALDNFEGLRQQSEGILAPDNLLLLYAGLAIVKTLHEFGHAAVCKRYGGEVHVMGLMMLIFTPVPYMDATASWGFRSRWQRMLVGAAGMIVEVFVAAIAVMVWANTGPGTLHSLAYNMIFVASVSTVLFNANPLLRYDGYYMLSDLLEIPNLYQRSMHQIRYLSEKYLYGIKKAESPATGRREAVWLAVYAVLSTIYRIIVFGGILLFVADRFLLIGLLMAVVCLIAWIFVPVGKFVNYLASSPRLDRHRPRAVAVSGLIAAGILGSLGLIPFPSHFRAPGIVEAVNKAQVVTEAAGYVEALVAQPGDGVQEGQALLRLRNPELEWDIRAARARHTEALALFRLAMQTNAANMKPVEKRLESVLKQIHRLETERSNLVVRSRQTGVWAAPEVKDLIGRWLPRGADLGLVLDPTSYRFTATVPQTDVGSLFERHIRSATVRLRGEAGHQLAVGELRVIPAGQRVLPSAALGWLAGGEVPIDTHDPEGRQAAEPFFEVKADFDPPTSPALFHGRSGKIRFKLAPEPLMDQWIRRLRQVLQKRYQL
jgi:putative peptide zinc metalloprotease protein